MLREILSSANARTCQILRTSGKPQTATMMSYVERVNRAIDLIVSRPMLNSCPRSVQPRLSPYHFHRVFQALVGETPGDFVKRLRLEKCCPV